MKTLSYVLSLTGADQTKKYVSIDHHGHIHAVDQIEDANRFKYVASARKQEIAVRQWTTSSPEQYEVNLEVCRS